jgi:hypothetical protein
LDEKPGAPRASLDRSSMLKWHKYDASETIWNMMGIPVGQEQSELNSTWKKLQSCYLPTAEKL